MYLIQKTLVSESVLEARFRCDVGRCKGACCWEGDFGAPLEADEVSTLQLQLPAIRPYLSPAGLDTIEKNGVSTYTDELGSDTTTLIDGGACAFLTLDEKGIAQCGIERAWEAGVTTFRKPISCHLYPIRVVRLADGMLGLNYDEWSICAPACARGAAEGLRLIDFAWEALVRRFGAAYVAELSAAASRHERGAI
jgi:hypothetical protein